MNSNLNKAKKAKNDEFYTRREDIEKEMPYYEEHLRGKVVYSNCDTTDSAFVQYFNDNKERLGIRDYIHYDGDFRSIESIDKLKQADIVITNPPFSLFREYFQQLIDYNKQFIIIGPIGAYTYKNIFPLIKTRDVILGVNKSIPKFGTPSGALKSVTSYWYTNIDHGVIPPPLKLVQQYDPLRYPRYDNYDAIEVSKVKDIPADYGDVIGVPLSFIEKHNPDQFEIMGASKSHIDCGELELDPDKRHGGFIDGVERYSRLFVKNKFIMGVPIRFLQHWNPDQFELVGVDRDFTDDNCRGRIDGKRQFIRVVIKKKTSLWVSPSGLSNTGIQTNLKLSV